MKQEKERKSERGKKREAEKGEASEPWARERSMGGFPLLAVEEDDTCLLIGQREEWCFKKEGRESVEHVEFDRCLGKRNGNPREVKKWGWFPPFAAEDETCLHSGLREKLCLN